MSIETEITRIKGAKSDIKTAIENKGITVGDGTIDTYASKIADIPTPTGKIEITENGENIDVSSYATADVNVSGGGGIPDQDIQFNDIIPSSSSASTSQTINVESGKNIGNIFVRPYDPNLRWPVGDYSTNNGHPSQYLESDNLFHYPLTINNETFDFVSYNTISNSTSDMNTTENSVENLVGYGNYPVVADVDNAVQWFLDNGKTTVKSGSTTVWQGYTYCIPLKFCNTDLNKYYRKPAVYVPTVSGWDNVNSGYTMASGGYYQFNIYSRGATDSTSHTVSTSTPTQDVLSSAKYFSYKINITSANEASYIADAVGNAAGWLFVVVRDGYTLTDLKNDLAADNTLMGVSGTFYYMEDGQEKSIDSNKIATPQPASSKAKWDSIVALDPSSITISVTDLVARPDLRLQAKLALTYTKKLSELVGNMTTATFNITDPQTYTTRSFKGVVLAEQGVDLNGIDPLSHGGYY